MRTRSALQLLGLVFLTLAIAPIRAEDATDAGSLADKLASSDFAERQKAIRSVDSDFIKNKTALLASEDPEAISAITDTLQFDQRLNAWLLQLATLSADVRKEQLAILNNRTLLPLLVKIFSSTGQSRAEGFRILATTPGIDADPLLIFSLRDDSPAVAFGTFELLWDRPASPRIVEALWQVGFRDGLDVAMHPPHRRAGETTTFRGMTVTFAPNASVPAAWDLRSQAAREVLVHLQSPRLESLANETLDDLVTQITSRKGGNIDRLRIPLGTLCTLISDHHFVSALPHLQKFLALSTESLEETPLIAVGPNPTSVYISIRTDALATFVVLTKQAPADYSLGRVADGVNWHSRSKEDESAAIDHLNEWWKQHVSQFRPALPQTPTKDAPWPIPPPLTNRTPKPYLNW